MSMNDVQFGLGLRCSPFAAVFLPLFLSLLCAALLFYALHFSGALDFLLPASEQLNGLRVVEEEDPLEGEDAQRR